MSGEKPGRREQIDNMTRHLVKQGGHTAEQARAKAVESAIRADRKEERKK